MTTAVLLLLVCLVVLHLLHVRSTRGFQAQALGALRLLRVTLEDIVGGQRALSDEYKEVHRILAAIRDLNQQELQDRKEVLQRTNISASSRVVQVRGYMQSLEEAAMKELEGRNG